MTSGTYPPLPNSTSIRALRFELLPSKSEIRGLLTLIDLDDENRAEYEALSYAWGDATPVACTTFAEFGLTIGIAQNLTDGLKRL